MREVFIDTYHLVAVFSLKDQLHDWAVGVERELGAVRFITSEMVLVEVLTLQFFP